MFAPELLTGRVPIRPRRAIEKLSDTVIERLGEATPDKAGLLSAADKEKLDGLGDIPVATTESAGLMSAADKDCLFWASKLTGRGENGFSLALDKKNNSYLAYDRHPFFGRFLEWWFTDNKGSGGYSISANDLIDIDALSTPYPIGIDFWIMVHNQANDYLLIINPGYKRNCVGELTIAIKPGDTATFVFVPTFGALINIPFGGYLAE